MATPNGLMIDAFKRVVDAVLAFDDLWLPDYGEIPKPLTREEAVELADYLQERVTAEHPEFEMDGGARMVSLGALSSILASLDHLNTIRDVLVARCDAPEGD